MVAITSTPKKGEQPKKTRGDDGGETSPSMYAAEQQQQQQQQHKHERTRPMCVRANGGSAQFTNQYNAAFAFRDAYTTGVRAGLEWWKGIDLFDGSWSCSHAAGLGCVVPFRCSCIL